jgi:hypothetical protein
MFSQKYAKALIIAAAAGMSKTMQNETAKYCIFWKEALKKDKMAILRFFS